MFRSLPFLRAFAVLAIVVGALAHLSDPRKLDQVAIAFGDDPVAARCARDALLLGRYCSSGTGR